MENVSMGHKCPAINKVPIGWMDRTIESNGDSQVQNIIPNVPIAIWWWWLIHVHTKLCRPTLFCVIYDVFVSVL